MSLGDKMKFVFNCYDFAEGGMLQMDELTLMFKSTVHGLCKLSSVAPPLLAEFEELSKLALAAAEKTTSEKMTVGEFIGYCAVNPTAESWMGYYDDIEEMVSAADTGGYVDPASAPPARGAELATKVAAFNELDDVTFDEAALGFAGAPCEAVYETLAGPAAAPTDPSVAPPAPSTAKPDSKLDLDWVYGINASGAARGSVKYVASGGIAFCAAALGVLWTPGGTEAQEKPKQSFVTAHVDAVTCLATSADGTLVATGEVGAHPKVVVWKAEAGCPIVCTLAGFHIGGVRLLAFSVDAGSLVTVGADTESSIAVYELATGIKVFSTVSKLPIHDVAFAGTGAGTFVTASPHALNFWTSAAVVVDGAPVHSSGVVRYDKKAGVLGAHGPKHTYSTVTALGGMRDLVASGSASGALHVWSGRNCACVVADAHPQPADEGTPFAVEALYWLAATKTLASGGTDGKVCLWLVSQAAVGKGKTAAGGKVTATLTAKLDLLNLPSAGRSVKSVCLSPDAKKALVTTAGAEVWELTTAAIPDESGDPEKETPIGASLTEGGGPLMLGAAAAVESLAPSPTGVEFATGAADGTVRVWDVESHRSLRAETLAGAGAVTALAYNAGGDTLAVGLASGKTLLLKSDGLVEAGAIGAPAAETVVGTGDPATLGAGPFAVTDLKFSPDGQSLGVACGAAVVLYAASGGLEQKGVCGAPSAVTKFDFSEEPGLVMIGTAALELVFFNLETFEVVPPADVKDKVWATRSCPLAFNYKGVAPAHRHAGPAGIVALDSSVTAALTVVADEFGALNVFPYPCVDPPVGYGTFAHHASDGAMSVAMVAGDALVLSVGGGDKCAMAWKLEVDEQVDEADSAPPEDEPVAAEDDDEAEKLEVESGDDEALADGVALERAEKSALFHAIRNDDMSALFGLETETGDSADKFMAVKPWAGNAVPPSSPPAPSTATPDDDLTLEWVHGYAGQSSHSNVRYNANGEIVYPAASIGVTLDKVNFSQRFMAEHTDDVTALAMHPDTVLAATGQSGKTPLLIVWDTTTSQTCRSLALNKGGRAVSVIAFSPDGKLLAAAAQDDEHTLHIFDWKESKLLNRVTGARSKLLALSFAPAGAQVSLMSSGVDHFCVWTLAGRNLSGKKGLFGAVSRKQTLTAAAWIGDAENGFVGVLGAHDGKLYKTDGGRRLTDGVDMHFGPVTTLYAFKALEEEGPCLVSAGLDGKIFMLDAAFEQKLSFDMSKPEYNCFKRGVSSVCLNADGRKVLVGTLGSEIFELSTADETDMNGGALVTGHCKDELWGLAVHPHQEEFCTVGDDKTLRVWAIGAHKCTRMLKLEDYARACCYSPNGHMIAIGLGGDVGRGKRPKDGTVLVVQTQKPELDVVKELRDSEQWISDIKFSPNGELLAAASHDGKVYVYDCLHNFPLLATCAGAASYAKHIDFTLDSAALQCSSGAYELLYFDAKSGEPLGDGAEKFKDEPFATWTLAIGWPVQGVYPPYADGTDINAVARTNDGSLVVTADDFGQVKLFRYPCAASGAATPKTFSGHAAHVTKVAVSHADDYVMSAGGRDRCVFQWKRAAPGAAAAAKAATASAAAAAALSVEDEAFVSPPPLAAPPAPTPPETPPDEPWLEAAAMLEYSSAPEPLAEGADGVPAVAVAPRGGVPPALTFAHGVSAQRNVLGYNAHGGLVYSLGRTGIIYSKKAHAQSFHSAHTAPIGTLTVSADGKYAVSGDAAAAVCVWEATSGVAIATLPVAHRGALTAIAFSKPGLGATRCASVGAEPGGAASLAVWASPSGAWTDGKKLTSAALTAKTVCFVAFGGEGAAYDLVTGGVGGPGGADVSFWKVKGRNLTSVAGTYGEDVASQPLLCGVAVGPKLVTGTLSGALYVWDGVEGGGISCQESLKGHAAPCAAICATSTGGCVTGGQDGWLKLWDANMLLLNAFELGSPVASIAADLKFTKIAAATVDGALHELVRDSGACVRLLSSHAGGGAAALAPCPADGDKYATCGADGTVRVWSSKAKLELASLDVSYACTALSWMPDGGKLVVGLGGVSGGAFEGKFIVIDGASVSVGNAASGGLSVTTQQHNAKAAVSAMAFAPDGTTLAVGSADMVVYLHAANDGFQLFSIFAEHSSPIRALDFSADAKYVRSACGARELKFFQALDGAKVENLDLVKDADWASETSPFGYTVLGAYPPADAPDGLELTAFGKAPSGDAPTLAVGDAVGGVKLYAFPAFEKGAPSTPLPAPHVGAIAALGFVGSGALLTAGAVDGAIMEWQ